jgi:hypothetical protein
MFDLQVYFIIVFEKRFVQIYFSITGKGRIKVTLNSFKIPAAILIILFLWGPVSIVGGETPMICRQKAPARHGVQTCETRALHEQDAEVLCESNVPAPAVLHRYTCTLSARDWSQPAPYAHTSRVWQCERDQLKTLLFDQDFADDATRCRLLCGNCETGWKPEEPDH